MKVAITADKIKSTSIIYFFCNVCYLRISMMMQCLYIRKAADALKAYRARVHIVLYGTQTLFGKALSRFSLNTTCTFVTVLSKKKGFNGTLSQSKGVTVTSIHMTISTPLHRFPGTLRQIKWSVTLCIIGKHYNLFTMCVVICYRVKYSEILKLYIKIKELKIILQVFSPT